MDQNPTLDEWRKLYTVAAQLKELAPWRWMNEDDIFGVRNPETNQLGFASVMGILGEHYAVNVYLGVEALYDFWNLENQDMEFPEDEEEFPDELAGAVMEQLLLIPQLQLSFEDRDDVPRA